MERIPLPWRALSEALGELTPGVHGLTGPIGAGKTQLALQIAAHAAETGHSVTLVHPRISASEIRARLEGMRRQEPWSGAGTESLPAGVTAGGVETIASTRSSLLVVDHFREEAAVLESARRCCLERSVAVIAVLEPKNPSAVRGAVPAELRDAPGPEIADWIGVDPKSAGELDTLMILAPTRPKLKGGWSSVDVVIAKHRRGLPSRAPLRFNGTWFEDEPELELDLVP